MGVFIAGVGVAIAAWGVGAVSAAWLAPLVVVFLLLVLRHDVVVRSLERARRAVRFYERGLARLDDTWAGTGNST